MNKFDYIKLTPFKWFVLENFPFIEADFDALTNWQLFCKLGKEVNKIIDSQNIVGTEMENTVNAFIELQNFVNNYFDNLDVQEEINNKLDEMIEDGSLQIILDNILNNSFGFNLGIYKTDDNTWQDALNYILENNNLDKYTIYLPRDKSVDSDLTINKPNIVLKNGVIENASLILDYTEDATDEFTTIENIKFIGTQTKGIEIKSAYYPTITNCIFNNKNDNVITYGILLTNVEGSFQNSRRVIITNNQFKDCSYAIYTNNPNTEFGASGDIIFSNNQVDTKVGGIYSVGVDGHIINGNVFFMPGYKKHDMNKMDNIYIKRSNFTEITNNSIFEAGRNGIHIEDTTSFIIANNNIDWCGQNTPASGIYAKITSSYGEFISSINDNLITYPTKSGIEIESNNNAGLLNVKGNNITAPGLTRYYYGDTDLSTIQHYCIDASTVKGCTFVNNLYYPTYNDNINALDNFVQNYTVSQSKNVTNRFSNKEKKDVTVTNLSDDIDLEGIYNLINLNAGGTFNFSVIKNAVANQIVRFVQYNTSGITWNTEDNVIYDKNAQKTTYQWATKEFIYNGSRWFEISESNAI